MRTFWLLIPLLLLTSFSFAVAKEKQQSPQDEAQEIRELQETQRQLLEQVRKELSLLRNPGEQTPAAKADHEHRRRQLLQLLAEIEKRINADNEGQRTRYVSASTTNGPVIQSYYDRLRRRIEEEGTRDFPKSDGRSLYGEVTILLTVSTSGKAESIEVLRSSTQRLSDHSVNLLKRLAPFEKFSEDLAIRADALVVPLGFRYSGESQ